MTHTFKPSPSKQWCQGWKSRAVENLCQFAYLQFLLQPGCSLEHLTATVPPQVLGLSPASFPVHLCHGHSQHWAQLAGDVASCFFLWKTQIWLFECSTGVSVQSQPAQLNGNCVSLTSVTSNGRTNLLEAIPQQGTESSWKQQSLPYAELERQNRQNCY